jgi:hypothetical protein
MGGSFFSPSLAESVDVMGGSFLNFVPGAASRPLLKVHGDCSHGAITILR